MAPDLTREAPSLHLSTRDEVGAQACWLADWPGGLHLNTGLSPGNPAVPPQPAGLCSAQRRQAPQGACLPASAPLPAGPPAALSFPFPSWVTMQLISCQSKLQA